MLFCLRSGFVPSRCLAERCNNDAVASVIDLMIVSIVIRSCECADKRSHIIVNDIDFYLISQNLNEHNERRVSLGFERTE